jgi:hypothetical protein
MTTDETIYSFEESGIRVVPGEHSTRIIWLGVWELRVPDLGIGPFFKALIPTLSGKKVIVDFLRMRIYQLLVDQYTVSAREGFERKGT